MSATTSSAVAPAIAASAERAHTQVNPPVASRAHTYGQILKSSAIIGGSSVVNIAVSIVRAKAMALMLGPAGVGLVGLYSSIMNLGHSIAGMGVNSSGVRQIAEAVGSGDTHRIALTTAVLRRTSMVLGILGAAVLTVFCREVSALTFGSKDYAGQIALLSLSLFFMSISDGQAALVQGMRRISDLARIGAIATVLGSAISLLLVYFFLDKGVVPSLVITAAIMLGISWWYRRKIEIQPAPITAAQAREEATALLTLGSVFMASAVLTTGAAYAVRIIVRDGFGLAAAGLYQSAWALGGLYVGFILQAMASDFYPRLTAVVNDHEECNRLVNEQAQVSLLLAGPGVVGTLTFAPLVIALLYDARFGGAVQPLRWICLGMALRVIAWPMGFIIVAKGARSLFFWTEIAATVVHVGLAWILVKPFGLDGATMAFFGLYIWHGLLVYALVRRMTGFRWSEGNVRTGAMMLPLIGIVFCGFLVLPTPAATTLGVVISFVSSIYSLRMLCHLVPLDKMPRAVREVLEWLHISPPLEPEAS